MLSPTLPPAAEPSTTILAAEGVAGLPTTRTRLRGGSAVHVDRRPTSYRLDSGRQRTGIVLALPAALLVLGLVVFPIGEAAYYSLTSWNGTTAHFIGLSSYSQLLFHTTAIRQILQNNLAVVASIPAGLMFALIAAFLTSLRVPGWRVFRFIVFLPVALSWVVIGIVFSNFLTPGQGMDSLFSSVGLHALSADWLGSTHTALPALLTTFNWALFGINTVIFMTGLASIPLEVIEAARVDGAGFFRILRYILLPLLARFVRLAFLVTMISGFSGMFGLIYVMTAGGPGFSTTTLEFQIYQDAFTLGNFGQAAALGMFLLFIMLTVTLMINLIGRRRSVEL